MTAVARFRAGERTAGDAAPVPDASAGLSPEAIHLVQTAEGVSVALRRGVGLVVGLLVVAVLISAAGMALHLGGRLARARRGPQLDAGAAARHRSARVVARRFHARCSPGPPRPASGNVLEALRKAKVDPRVGAIVIAPSRLQAPLWAQGAGGARGHPRLPQLGQARLRLSRIRGRPRLLPRHRVLAHPPDALEPARR